MSIATQNMSATAAGAAGSAASTSKVKDKASQATTERLAAQVNPNAQPQQVAQDGSQQMGNLFRQASIDATDGGADDATAVTRRAKDGRARDNGASENLPDTDDAQVRKEATTVQKTGNALASALKYKRNVAQDDDATVKGDQPPAKRQRLGGGVQTSAAASGTQNAGADRPMTRARSARSVVASKAPAAFDPKTNEAANEKKLTALMSGFHKQGFVSSQRSEFNIMNPRNGPQFSARPNVVSARA